MDLWVRVSISSLEDVSRTGRERELCRIQGLVHIGEILWDLHSLMGWFVGNLDVMGVL